MQSGRNMAGLLLAMMFTISNLTPAYAHQPINLTAANSSANKGPIIVDGKVSFVIRANFTKPNQTQGFRAALQAGETLYFEYLIIDLSPPLKFFGSSDAAMNIIIVGITLGLQFGGGILIKEVNSGKIDKQSVFLSILMINLIHALFEDTLLMLLVGGHYSGVIFARIFFGLVISLLMLKCYQKYSKFFEKHVFDEKLRLLPEQKIN